MTSSKIAELPASTGSAWIGYDPGRVDYIRLYGNVIGGADVHEVVGSSEWPNGGPPRMDKAERFRELRLTEVQWLELQKHRRKCTGTFSLLTDVTMEEAERLGFLDEPAPEPAKPMTTYWGHGDGTWVVASGKGFDPSFARPSDERGIVATAAAFRAKSLKPAPEPVHCVLGESVAEADLREALAMVRAKNAPPAEKQTPRGLMVVREFDHRLGLWTGEV